jgi:hypothetical protein
MTGIRNPYIVGKPVQGEAFYGRDQIMAEIERRLPNERLLILYGPRRIGKTSILQNLHLMRRLSRFAFIYVDRAQMATYSIAQVRYHIASEIARIVNIRIPHESAFEDSIFLHRNLLPWACRTLDPKRLVLILDEFDGLDRLKEESAGRAESLLDFTQELIEAESRLAIMIGLGPRPGELSRSLQHYLPLNRWIRVPLLELEAVRSLIVNPTAGQMTYAPEAIDHIIALTSGHPYFIQLICSEIFDYVGRDGREYITLEDVEVAAALALEKGKSDLGWLWEDLTPAERLTLALCAEASDEKGSIKSRQLNKEYADHTIHYGGQELKDAVNLLVELEIVRREKPRHLRFVVELVRHWVAIEHPVAAERDESARRLDEVRAQEGLAQVRLAQAQESQRPGLSRKAIMIASGIGVLAIACLVAGLAIPIKGQPLLGSLTSPATPAQEIASLPSTAPTPVLEVSEPTSVSDTATPTMTPVPPTHTPVPVLTSTATEPTPSVPDTPASTMTPTSPADMPTPTPTPEAPSDTPTAASTFTPTPSSTPTPLPATPVPTATPIPASISTPAATPTPAPSIPTGGFTLLYPLTRDDISYGPTDFEWEWTGSLSPGLGFEVRVWREGEFPSGVHDAVLDNQNGNIKNMGGSEYHLSTDIREAPGVQGRSGEYLWTVALVQISPQYQDLGQQAEPARLRFEAGGGGGGDGGDGGGGGVGID